jgi:hypothetical protein
MSDAAKTRNSAHHAHQQGAKRVYKAPFLQRFGSVSQLTQSGGTGSDEDSQSGNMNMQKPNASDRILKQDIALIGQHPLGFGLYLFNYRPEYRDTFGHARQFGVMADEVELVRPEAVVTHADGYKMVHYGLLGIDRSLQ